jgi:D-alanine-D-alanine ligase
MTRRSPHSASPRRPRAMVLFAAQDTRSPLDEQDVLTEVAVVSRALERLGWSVTEHALDLDLGVHARTLGRRPAAMVFNLVESLGGDGQLIYLATTLLDHLGLPYTGAPTEAVFLTTHKVLAKRTMAAAGIPTPHWIGEGSPAVPSEATALIIKPVWEDASVGIDDRAVVRRRSSALRELRRRDVRDGRPHFAESYIEGREFNISLLAREAGRAPQVLPIAEIHFLDFAKNKPRIVGYRAKWDVTAHEFSHTPRSFDFPARDRSLLRRLRQLALRCWRLFGLRGYGRVDLRVDRRGRPWVLEVNANPCLSPDAGYFAAAQRAELSMEDVVQRIIGDLNRPSCRP